MTTIETIWNAIVPYLTAGTLTGVGVTAVLTGLKLVKYQKATRIDAIQAIEDKLASLSVNKDIRLSLETLNRSQLKAIEKALTERLDRALELQNDRTEKILHLTETIVSALTEFKALPSHKTAELSAALGLTAPATIVELKPIELEKPVKKKEQEQVEKPANPFAG
jgi:hypothetical protein